MWTRAELKERAKAVLKTNYWKAFIVALVMVCLGCDSSGSNSGIKEGQNCYHHMELDQLGFILITVGSIATIIMLIAWFVGHIIEVGGKKFFIKAAEGETNMGYLGYGFKSNSYWDIFKTMFFCRLIIFLWTLLLIIPGIVKGYAYRMVPYILADNPNIGTKRAMELSDEMTRGQKWDIFVLDLSFIGWYILGAIALGIGTLFVRPYDYATNAELYLVLREDALQGGLCSYEELNIRKDMLV